MSRAEDAVRAVVPGRVVPVPFVGTRWVERGAGYWWRRIGGTLIYLLGVGITGGAAVGLAVNMIGGSPGTVLTVVWLATAAPGLWIGWRMARRLPTIAAGPRTAYGGCFALVLLPFTAGVCLVFFGAALRPQFLGETRARELSRAAVAAPRPGQRPDRRR